MLKKYFSNLYNRTMTESYDAAFREISAALGEGGLCLDCGASTGGSFLRLRTMLEFEQSRYCGVEWSAASVQAARAGGFNIIQADLNEKLPFDNGHFRCVFGVSVLEHLLNGCRFLKECHRVLEKNGTLVLLTPNISTFFTIALLLAGKMPSSGPHPDSNALLVDGEVFKVSDEKLTYDTESETPVHRHLVVFSFRVLRRYLAMIGFTNIKGYGFGLYPFPLFMQPFLEKIDPYHCHQMVFVAKRE